MTGGVTHIYVVCFACAGSGKEPDYGGSRVCIWCEGKGRRRARRKFEVVPPDPPVPPPKAG